MKTEYIDQCLKFATTPATFYSGSRKIIRGQTWSMKELFDDPLEIGDIGFTKMKLRLLEKLYLHRESRDFAVGLWERRLGQRKYGSVSFTTFNHLVKADPSKQSKRASVMGPCIQSVCLTLLKDRTVAIDCFYRTTEFFKKFGADLVFLRDTLLQPFEIEQLHEVRFHFANLTCHPMYFVTLIPLMKAPIAELKRIKKVDPHFYNWTVKWTARYICEEYSRGIAKFAQSVRVQKDALERIKPKTLLKLQDYVRKNHPGYRNEYHDPNDE